MIKIVRVEILKKDYVVALNTDNRVARELLQYLPISSEAHNIGGEIYFRVPGVNIQYDGSETEEFEIDDVVYWRSPIGEDKFAIAMFYGKTQYSDWKTPRASSPCVKIGKLVSNIDDMISITTGESVQLLSV